MRDLGLGKQQTVANRIVPASWGEGKKPEQRQIRERRKEEVILKGQLMN